MNRGRAMPAGNCASVGSRGAHDVPLSLEQSAEARGTDRLASLLGASVGNRCGREISSFREEAAEVECTLGIPPLVGTTVSRLRARDVAPSFKQQTNMRCGRRLAALVCNTERLLGVLRRSSILVGHRGCGRVVLGLAYWTVGSFFPHADRQFYRLDTGTTPHARAQSPLSTSLDEA